MKHRLTSLLGSKTLFLFVGVPLAVGLAAATAIAYFTAPGSGSATAGVGVLSTPAAPSPTAGAGTVALTWSTVSPPTGNDTITYYIQRDGGNPGGNCPTAAAPSTATSCTDSGLAAGTYHYTVTAIWRSWRQTSSSAGVTLASGALDHFSLSAASTTPTAGATDNLTITAKDSAGNSVTTYGGDQTLTFSGASTIGGNQPTVTSKTGTAVAFGTSETISFTNGVASVSGSNNGVMTLYKAESATVTVSDGTHTGNLSVTVSPLSAVSYTLSAPGSATAGSSFSATLTAKDTYGNTATGYTGSHAVDFSGPHSSPGGTSPSYPASVSFTSGAGTASVTLYDAETTTLTAADHATPSITGTSGSVVVGPGSAASLSLAAASTTPSAGTTDNLTITAKDTWLNTATSYTGDKSLTFGGASTAVSGTQPTVTSKTGTAVNFGTAETITFTSGVASVSGSNNGVMTLYKAETASITVSDGSISNGSGLSVTVSAGTAASLSLSAASTTPTAGTTDNLTITAKDTWLNTARGYTGDKSLTFGGASTAVSGTQPTVTSKTGTAVNFGTAETITFTSGVASVSGSNNGVMTLYKAETASITVSDGSISNGSGLSVTVSAGTAASLSLAAASTTPTAGTSDNLTITAKDTWLNTATGYTGDKSLTFGGASTATSGTQPTVTSKTGTAVNFGTAETITFTSGVASVSGSNNGVMTLYMAETASITVTDGTISNGSGLSVTVGPGSAASLSLAAASTTPTAGVADNLTITAKDTWLNTATGYVGNKSLTFGGAANAPSGTHPTVLDNLGSAVNFGTATTITFVNGVATAGVNNGVMTLYKAETASITVTDGTLTNGSGLSVTVGSGSATTLSLSVASTTPTAGAADNLTITAKDTWLNTATGYTGDKSLTFGGASTAASGTHPTVTSKTGTAVNFGTAETITFTSGVATVSGSNNGVMTLYKAESPSITVTDGTLSNGSGLSVTVSPGTAASLTLSAASTTPTAGTTDNLTITAKDTWLNTATGYTGDKSLTFGGASTAVSGTQPTVSSKTGTAVNFGTATTITFTSGVASVSGANNGVMTLYKVETASVTVTDGTISNGSGLSVTVGPGSAASLSLAAASTTPTAGTTDNLTVTAKDTWLNTATSYTGDKSLTFGGASTATSGTQPTVTSKTGTPVNFGTAETITFTSGVASVSGSSNGVMTLYKAETTSITVTDGTLTNGSGLPVTVASGSAASLSLAAASTTPTAGATDNLTIAAKDTWLNTATGYTGDKSLTFGGASTATSGTQPTVSSKTGTTVAFGTATTITFTSGVATVSGSSNGVMTLYKVESPSITVTDGTISNGSGLSVTVSPGTAASLTLSAPSTTPTAGTTDNLTITAKDTWLNTATGYTGDKSLTFGGASTAASGTQPAVTSKTGTAVAFGTATTITFTSGVATVSGSNNGVMTLYKAESPSITVTDGTISNGSGLSVTVAPGTATSLSLSAASTTPTAGTTDNLTITAKDSWLNTATGYTGSKNLTFSGASTINGNNPTVTNSSGTATAFGTTTAITFTSGVASVSGSNNGVMKLYKAETASVTVSDGSISNGSGLSVTVSATTASKLGFTQQPSASTGGVAFATQPKVAVQDTYGNTVTTDSSSVTLAITGGTGTAGATLSCTTNPLTASSGVATFAGCKIDKSGNGYTLTATDGSLTSTASSSFNITVGAAAQLAFTQQPSGAAALTAFTTQPKVTVQDAGGNTVTTDSSSVTLAITTGTGTSGATLTCTTNPVAASSGVATFAGCKIDRWGTGYTLTATDGSLTSAVSSSFTNQWSFQALGTPSTLSSGSSTSFTTSNSYTSVSGAVVLVIVSAHESTSSPTLSVSGGPTTGSFVSLPAAAVKTKGGSGNSSCVQAFWALGASSTAAFTITGAATISDAVVEVVQIAGAKTSAPIVGSPVSSTGTTSPASATFSAPLANDAQILVVGSVVGSATTVTPPGGFTELQDAAGPAGTNGQSLESSYTLSPVTGSTSASLSQSTNWGAIGIEFAHS